MTDTTGHTYKTFILGAIREARGTHGYSGVEWLYPIRGLYVGLAPDEQEFFHLELVDLLKHPEEAECSDCLTELIQLCQSLEITESCSVLIELSQNPPPNKKFGDFYVGGETLRANAWAALGELKCKSAIPLLTRQLKEAHEEVRRLSTEDIEKGSPACNAAWNKGPAILALVKVAPDKAKSPFGWWLSFERRVVHQGDLRSAFAMLKQMEQGIIGFVGLCLQAVLKSGGGLVGLQDWLRSLSLLDESDRQYLAESFELVMGSKDFRSGIEGISDETNLRRLAAELAKLPMPPRQS